MTVQPPNTRVDDEIDDLLTSAGITEGRDLIARIIRSGLGLGEDDASRLDLKITASALAEMRAAFRLFAPHADRPKATVFGSARTRPDDPLYALATAFATAIAREGWMVVTGAGPGIMQAAVDGAGEGNSLGVSIRLPFEPETDEIAASRVTMKYFFTRKLMLMKESAAFVCLPGGVGTLDETFELLTLQQTGKAEPAPIVLLDRPGGTFWQGLADYMHSHLVTAGYVSPDDLDRFFLTDSVDEAVAHILGFWRNYHSLRWVGDTLVLRLRQAPSDEELAVLSERFAFLLREGEITRTQPLSPEVQDADRLDLPRIALVPDKRRVGSLFQLIAALNEVPPVSSEGSVASGSL